jgi:hypothetical protein
LRAEWCEDARVVVHDALRAGCVVRVILSGEKTFVVHPDQRVACGDSLRKRLSFNLWFSIFLTFVPSLSCHSEFVASWLRK